MHPHAFVSPSATNATSITASPSNVTLVPTSSPSRSNSQAAKSASITRRPSPSATTYCALVPADGELAVGRLQVFNESSATSGAIPLRPSLLGTSPGAARVSRAVLLRNTPFGANLSLALGGTIRGGPVDGWRIVNVAMDVVPVNSLLPLLTAVVPFTLMSDAVVGRTQSLAVMIDPSNATTPPRWLPASLSTFRDVTMVLQLSLRCPIDDAITAIVTVQVPCPGEVQPLASEVKAAGGVAQYSASLAGPVGGGAVARVAAVRSLVQCSGDSVVEGLLPLVVDACGDDWARGSSVASGARGGILGNFVLWVAACMLMALAVVVYAHLGRTTLLLAAEALGVPSPLLPLIVVTLPSTVSSTFYLIHSPSCGSDNVVAAFGVLMLVSPMGVLCILAYAVPSQLAVVIHEQASSPNTARSCRLVVAHILSSLVRRRVRWRELHVDTRDATTSSGGQVAPTQSGRRPAAHTLLRAATVLLLDYASVWYACVDIAVLTASCVLGAMGMLGSASACRGGAISILVLFSVQLALCAAVRPFTSLFSHVAALFMLVLSVIAIACQVWYLFGSAAENADLNALSKLLTAAAACDLLVSGASLLKSLLDIVDTLKACHRHLSVLCATSPTRKLPLNQIMENTQKLLISGDVELLCEDVVLPTQTALDDDDILLTLEVEEPFEDGGGIFTASERIRATNDNDLIRGLELVEEHLSNIFDDEGDEHS
ncbi:transmembrane protein, putative [Bodo saltans]|uniref:Transmembrane protein, putative n=1 Tax=Bodo saltans TaxID=75058 RepID=A0A0S4JK94_BODSA|nr:transmembrane protein, putative [Bodo saltans]|eukprot:CUG89613.1 transmembrane protein, putative [Bodo saltans]